jgi:hypothetical protein
MAPSSTPPLSGAPSLDLLELDLAAEALLTGHPAARPPAVIGHGEVSVVLAWPPSHPTWAVKRLPSFASDSAAEEYRALLATYVLRLASRGVDVVATSLFTTPGPRGRRHAYLVQPLLSSQDLLSRRLRSCTAEQAEPWLADVTDLVLRVVDDGCGLDAQVANWAVTPPGTPPAAEGSGLRYVDVSTPFLNDGEKELLDQRWILSPYPAVLRPALRRFAMPQIVAHYHSPDTVLLDVAGNLLREGLDRHLEVLVAVAARRGLVLSRKDATAYARSDERTWHWLHRARLADRWWQRTVRRRSYPFLLPERRHG